LKWSLILLGLLLAGCQTTADSVASSGGGSQHPDLPANYRQQIAEFMRTQLFAKIHGIRNAEISDPNRAFAGLINGGDRDFVCIRFGGTVRAYVFVDGKLPWDNGGPVAPGIALLFKQCGEKPNFKPCPEADFQPA
jgi:hypothetical protein